MGGSPYDYGGPFSPYPYYDPYDPYDLNDIRHQLDELRQLSYHTLGQMSMAPYMQQQMMPYSGYGPRRSRWRPRGMLGGRIDPGILMMAGGGLGGIPGMSDIRPPWLPSPRRGLLGW